MYKRKGRYNYGVTDNASAVHKINRTLRLGIVRSLVSVAVSPAILLAPLGRVAFVEILIEPETNR